MPSDQSSDNSQGQLHQEKLFENNIMPKLIREYYADHKVKTSFDLERIKAFTEEGGLHTRAWDEKDLQKNVDALVRKGLVDELGGGRYQISDKGLE